jgi:hypothetical protein
MPYSYTFKRGKSTTGTDLPNHFFVDGNVLTSGIGTSTSPFKTILQAKNALSGGTQQTIVVAPFTYLNDLVNTSFPSNNFLLLGDSDNYDVVLTTNQTINRPFSGGNDWYSENIVFEFYDMGYGLPSYNTYHHSLNCVYKDCTKVAESSGFSGTVGAKLTVINSKFIATSNTVGHLLFNCEIQNDGPVRNAVINNSFVDQGCTLKLNSATDTITFNNCYFENKTAFLASNPNPANLTIVITNERTGNPLWNYTSGTDGNGHPALGGFDFSVSSRLSGLIASTTSPIGAKPFKGITFNTSNSAIQALVSANTNLEIFNGNIRFKNSVASGTVTELGGNGEIQFTTSTRNYLTTPRQLGIGYNAFIEFYVRVKDNPTDPFGDWKKYRLGEPMGVDLSGKTTGEDGFKWHELQRIRYSTSQAKLVLTKA